MVSGRPRSCKAVEGDVQATTRLLGKFSSRMQHMSVTVVQTTCVCVTKDMNQYESVNIITMNQDISCSFEA